MHLPRLVASLLIPLAIGTASGLFTAGSVRTWYPQIRKPWFTPPSWVFGPVWTTLYVMMGVALYLVWQRSPDRGVRWALALFAAQLLLNGVWSLLFFGLRAPGLAFVEILVLLATIVATAVAFWQVRPVAGMLFVPYVLWVAFASALNGAIWLLNRGG